MFGTNERESSDEDCGGIAQTPWAFTDVTARYHA